MTRKKTTEDNQAEQIEVEPLRLDLPKVVSDARGSSVYPALRHDGPAPKAGTEIIATLGNGIAYSGTVMEAKGDLIRLTDGLKPTT